VTIGVVGDQLFSVGGERAASGSAPCGYCKGPVTVYDVRTHTARRLGNPKQANEDAALSPDGTRVAYSSPAGIVVRPVAGGVAHPLGVGGGCATWSPNGRTLAFYNGNILETIPVTGGKPTVLLHRAVCGTPPVWSPDSQNVALTYGPNRLTLVNVRTGAVRKTPISAGRAVGITWSPDGTSLVVSFRRGYDYCGNVERVDPATLARTTLVRGCP
jgi:Tol biopolymer transport system component